MEGTSRPVSNIPMFNNTLKSPLENDAVTSSLGPEYASSVLGFGFEIKYLADMPASLNAMHSSMQ